jgi:type IV pilus assembly protein PilY1
MTPMLLCRLAGLVVGLAAHVATAAIPEVQIAQEPLYSGRANIHPNLLLSLSVEFPTAGVAYRGDNGTYNRTREYIGYFNPLKCYVYQGGNRNLGDDAYFRIHKEADPVTRECGGDSFSGNFMNWAASSAIDMLRYALTGGDRVVDTPEHSVLQRAVLRDAPSSNFYAHSTYFPRRRVTAGGNVSAPRMVTPFNTEVLYIVSCRNRILFSDVSSGISGSNAADGALASTYCTSEYDGIGTPPKEAQDKRLGEYLVRVRVCDEAEGAQRRDLCLKYKAHYKPVGELQRRAAMVRVGAMGYLLDDSERRYGGVLRAPLGYLGATRYEAPEFVRVPNPQPEWDPLTGVLYVDPAHPTVRDGGAQSGVINYLNKFGRNAHYKTYDPLSELYYEGLRYFQGRQPTPAATSGMSVAMHDGFPVLERWSDPVTASCQRNYILAVADVNTHWDRFVPGNERTTYGNHRDAFDSARPADAAVAGKTPALDIRDWARKVGQMEADTDGVFSNPAPNAALGSLDTKDTGAGGHGTYYMAGLAYWANTNDVRLDKPTRVQTFAIDVDEGGNGLIDGNTRALKPRESQLYLAAKYGGFTDRNGDGNPFITIAPDGKAIVRGSDAEWDNGNGVPANYFLAGQPREMIQAVRRVFANIGSASGTLAGAAVSSAKLSSDGAYVFKPGFDPASWSGTLGKFRIGLDESHGARIAGAAEWDAGEILSGSPVRAAQPLHQQRRIYTPVVESGAVSTVEFRWDRLPEQQRALLALSPADGVTDGLGEERLDYVRGARDRELAQPGGIFRSRSGVLGDIVNSNPVYVGAPSARVSGTDYASFFERNRTRVPAVYVGANDGMLHAFNAESGAELFAYVPNVLVPALPELTAPEYTHRPYVDGGLAAAEAMVRGEWKTVLAGTTGGGAQAVFALDITNPGDFGAGGGVLFEFTDADDADLGNVLGEPAIAKFKAGVKDGLLQYAYFVVVASGVNNYAPDGEGRHNEDGAGALFLLALDKPASAKWKLGTNYYKLRLPAPSVSDHQNGLAQPSLLTGADGTVHRAYAGDLQGNLWRFDFAGNAPWTQPHALRQPLYVARDRSGRRQPITSAPQVVFAQAGYFVLFGTGKFIEPADAVPGNFGEQSFYAVFDAVDERHVVHDRSELVPRVLEHATDGSYSIQGAAFQYGAESGARKGWYVDFLGSDESGERVVSNGSVLNGMLYFNTIIPGADPCATGGGRSYVLGVLSGMPRSGQTTGYLSEVGMLGAPLVLQTGAEVGLRNAVGRRLVQRREAIINFGTGGVKGTAAPAEKGPGVSTVRAGRLSWREIPNVQELRHDSRKK